MLDHRRLRECHPNFRLIKKCGQNDYPVVPSLRKLSILLLTVIRCKVCIFNCTQMKSVAVKFMFVEWIILNRLGTTIADQYQRCISNKPYLLYQIQRNPPVQRVAFGGLLGQIESKRRADHTQLFGTAIKSRKIACRVFAKLNKKFGLSCVSAFR